jgi:hypothetical protein
LQELLNPREIDIYVVLTASPKDPFMFGTSCFFRESTLHEIALDDIDLKFRFKCLMSRHTKVLLYLVIGYDLSALRQYFESLPINQ